MIAFPSQFSPAFVFEPPLSDAHLEWALAYARAGMRVFPVDAMRHPLTIKGVYSAVTDPNVIAQWWTRWPGADPAWAVPHEFVVVDLDMKDGRNGLRDFLDLERLVADDIETPQALSPTVTATSFTTQMEFGLRIRPV